MFELKATNLLAQIVDRSNRNADFVDLLKEIELFLVECKYYEEPTEKSWLLGEHQYIIDTKIEQSDYNFVPIRILYSKCDKMLIIS